MPFFPNLTFPGNAEEVLEYYRDAFGGELTIMRFGGSPAADQVPADWAGKVVYGTLESPLGTVNCMDATPDRAGEPGGNVMLSLQPPTAAETEKIFAKLSAGGTLLMPLEPTFWSPLFGMCIDKFGTKWMVGLAPAA